jgi:hypothetical protein
MPTIYRHVGGAGASLLRAGYCLYDVLIEAASYG